MPYWWWGPEIVVVEDTRPRCVWREASTVPGFVFSVFAGVPRVALPDGTGWKQAEVSGIWWAEHSAPDGKSAVYYTCEFLPAAPGVGATMQVQGVGAIYSGSAPRGLGILGDPNLRGAVPVGTYEITGTQVALRATPNGAEIGRFNNRYGENNHIVVEPVDTVEATGNVDLNIGGHNWAQVSVKSGELAGKNGFVATDYVGPIGYTKAKGGTGPAPTTPPLPADRGIEQVKLTDAEKKSPYMIPLVVGGLAIGALVIGGLLMKKRKKKRAVGYATEARRRRRRRYRR